jgi:preprotein translocase subunit SecG
MGGYSAFGTRAGDIFTRITIVAAALWLLAAMALTKINTATSQQLYDNPGPDAPASSRTTGTEAGDSGKGTDESSGKEKSPVQSEGTQPIDTKSATDADSKSQ